MITRRLWSNFGFKLDLEWNYCYVYNEKYMALLLIGYLLITPFTLILDILLLPIEIIYQIFLKIIRKLRQDY